MDRNKGERGLKRAFLVFAAAAFLCMAGAGGVFADSLVFQSGGSLGYGGVYVGPYQVLLNGVSTNLICDDYTDHIDAGEKWTATANTWADLSSMKFYGNTTFGNSVTGAAQAYEEVFYLTAQMGQTTNPDYIAAIHYAIWAIMDPKDNPAISTGVDPHASSTYWLGQAAISTNYLSVNPNDFIVYTPIPGVIPEGATTPPQEFVRVVPVPPSVLLLGTGLLSFVGLRRRPKR